MDGACNAGIKRPNNSHCFQWIFFILNRGSNQCLFHSPRHVSLISWGTVPSGRNHTLVILYFVILYCYPMSKCSARCFRRWKERVAALPKWLKEGALASTVSMKRWPEPARYCSTVLQSLSQVGG